MISVSPPLLPAMAERMLGLVQPPARPSRSPEAVPAKDHSVDLRTDSVLFRMSRGGVFRYAI